MYRKRTERQTERQTDRETDKQTNRQTDRQTETQRQRHRERPRESIYSCNRERVCISMWTTCTCEQKMNISHRGIDLIQSGIAHREGLGRILVYLPREETECRIVALWWYLGTVTSLCGDACSGTKSHYSDSNVCLFCMLVLRLVLISSSCFGGFASTRPASEKDRIQSSLQLGPGSLANRIFADWASLCDPQWPNQHGF